MEKQDIESIHFAIEQLAEMEELKLPLQNAIIAFCNQKEFSFEEKLEELDIEIEPNVISEHYSIIVEYFLEIVNGLYALFFEFNDFLKTDEVLKIPFEEKIKVYERKHKWLEILVEEPSMENVLDIILPQILPEGYELGINCFVRPHQGKSDLQKSIPRKVMAYQRFPQPVKLIVIQDQDSNDCMVLKQELIDLIMNRNSNQSYLVRIACRELENWYLGDMQAIETVYPTFKARTHQLKAKYRNPDSVSGADDLERKIKNFAKGFASKNIPQHMDISNNKSPSFNHLVSGVQRFLN